ncbi:duf455 domain-containing protein [Stemphylium lycopersici]|uniref:polynucleotide adenylyltransferase n=1 Tax=Stemphylium lycopersici TaxID=183478 RepID=A0A364N4Y2_STELY|nr:duf455 domain-containing protein [Stemphylium lycopersici]RAR12150.1 duf455 domain-containing protein [Stemphylium lycopersici]
MTFIDASSSTARIPTKSYDTALCVIPPRSQCGHVDQLRELYDKAYGKWPAHINLIYPFVAPEHLPRAQQQIQDHLAQHWDPNSSTDVALAQPGCFMQKNKCTIFLAGDEGDGSPPPLNTLRDMALEALGQGSSSSTLHLTVGQSQENPLFSEAFLLRKARLLPTLQFRVATLAILIRERTTGSDSMDYMRLHSTITLDTSGDITRPDDYDYWIQGLRSDLTAPESGEEASDKEAQLEMKSHDQVVQSGLTYFFNEDECTWSIYAAEEGVGIEIETLTVASYNVLMETEYPPTDDRDPSLVSTILSDSAMSEVLVLQEVSDEFLSYLLNDAEIQRRYPFASHGPPTQPDIGPLSNLRNIVILSCYPFSWKSVPFHRKHKGAIIAQFRGVAVSKSSGSEGLVVAGVHLTAGLTDGAVATKKAQMKTLISYLQRNHKEEPWVVTGDFNITTSSYTIDAAIQDKSITDETTNTLAGIETVISDAGILDAWSISRVEATDQPSSVDAGELFEGEEGATFDPQNNKLAAGTTTTSHDRPQRYDRILVRPNNVLRVCRFNQFGHPESIDGAQIVASDHYGVRSRMRITDGAVVDSTNDVDPTKKPPYQVKRAVASLSDSSETSALASHAMFPTPEQTAQRRDAYAILEQIILGASNNPDSDQPNIPLVMISVGSYALDIWTSDSDIDCLCIGTISSKTFFKLARQRMIKAGNSQVRILRKVEASTGTMLELSVNGVLMDMQYCPAAQVVERWPEFASISASDPIFNLSVLSLRKLKPYRDLLYIQRTLPSRSTFRMAHRCIKLWAVQRGLYSAKFGYLGGVHITLMLSWVYKRLAHGFGSVSVADLVVSFFNHYAYFDWANEVVYDAFFHKKKPRYHRSTREPMVILGFHAPNSNIAHTATIPGLQVLVKELKAADSMLSRPGVTWEEFFGVSTIPSPELRLSPGAVEFLNTYNNFVKIDIQFWGRILAKGKSLVGWAEARCISLVVALPESEVRIWPARFMDNTSKDVSGGNDYQGCYLIGLAKGTRAISATSPEEKQIIKQALEKVLDRFLTQLRTDDKNYDATSSWIDVSLAKSRDIRGLQLDDREWGDHTVDLDDDSDDEEDLEEDLEDADSVKPQRAIPQRPKPTPAPLSRTKLRPASDVLNRLRWDPSLDPSDYIIGYEDRFLGAKETGLEKWKTEQTDEEFIPQHRILYFKKKGGDGGAADIVWERATRIDKSTHNQSLHVSRQPKSARSIPLQSTPHLYSPLPPSPYSLVSADLQETFIAHESLCKACLGNIAAALKPGCFEEGKTQIFPFVHEDPTVFRSYLNFVYRPVEREEVGEKATWETCDETFTDLCKVYVLAEMLIDEAMEDAVSVQIIGLCMKPLPRSAPNPGNGVAEDGKTLRAPPIAAIQTVCDGTSYPGVLRLILIEVSTDYGNGSCTEQVLKNLSKMLVEFMQELCANVMCRRATPKKYDPMKKELEDVKNGLFHANVGLAAAESDLRVKNKEVAALAHIIDQLRTQNSDWLKIYKGSLVMQSREPLKTEEKAMKHVVHRGMESKVNPRGFGSVSRRHRAKRGQLGFG